MNTRYVVAVPLALGAGELSPPPTCCRRRRFDAQPGVVALGVRIQEAQRSLAPAHRPTRDDAGAGAGSALSSGTA
jgi:hypothetical protein